MKTKPKRNKAIWTTAFPEQLSLVQKSQQRLRYQRKARSWKKKHPTCQACSVLNCRPRATNDVHHLAGRVGDLLMDDTKWMAVCRECHSWIHNNIKAAQKLGLLAKSGDWGKQ